MQAASSAEQLIATQPEHWPWAAEPLHTLLAHWVEQLSTQTQVMSASYLSADDGEPSVHKSLGSPLG
jgi:hypothetical protein